MLMRIPILSSISMMCAAAAFAAQIQSDPSVPPGAGQPTSETGQTASPGQTTSPTGPVASPTAGQVTPMTSRDDCAQRPGTMSRSTVGSVLTTPTVTSPIMASTSSSLSSTSTSSSTSSMTGALGSNITRVSPSGASTGSTIGVPLNRPSAIGTIGTGASMGLPSSRLSTPGASGLSSPTTVTTPTSATTSMSSGTSSLAPCPPR